jgi:hypothetical protein
MMLTVSDTLNPAKVKRYLEWNLKLKTKMPAIYDACGGKFPLPEDLPPEVVDVLSKVLVQTVVGAQYGDAKINERMEYGTNLVRHANLDLQKIPPFFASANVENGDMYIWTCAAHAYAEHLMAQPGFLTTTSGIARDVFRIQHPHPHKERAARPASSARTNKKKARPNVAAATSGAQHKTPAFRSYARIRWKSAIRMQIKLNRMYRVETAKNIVESMRRLKVRRAAEAARAARTEAPFSVKGPSGPAPKCASVYEPPSVGDQAKRECHKAESIEKSNEHRRWLEENESLRVAQAEQQLEALRIASLIQNGDAL